MITHSPTLVEFAPALVAAQTELTNPTKDARGQVRGRTDYRYLSLAALIEATRPILNQHGLAISQHPNGDGSIARVTTVLLHTSGEWMASDAACAVTEADPQKLGSIISYLRRYGWQAVIGVCAEDDDDGASVAQHVQAQAPAAAPAQRQAAPASAPKPAPAKAQAAPAHDAQPDTVIDVTTKDGQGAKGPWTLYRVKLASGVTASTFKKDLGDAAQWAMSHGATVYASLERTEKGHNLTALHVVPPADEGVDYADADESEIPF